LGDKVIAMHIHRRFFIPCLALFLGYTLASTAHAATDARLFTFKTILPGSTTILDMEQSAAFPLGCPQLFLLTAGSGTLNITLQKNDVSGDAIFMLGLAASGGNTSSIFRTGISKGLITKSVVLSADSQSYGLVWIYSGVLYSAISPVYAYTIQLSFEP
jgi:hypothetical protein